jgi:hypothetical protein
LAFLTLLLAISVFLAMCALLGWHVFLVTTGQGTIDAFGNYCAERVRIMTHTVHAILICFNLLEQRSTPGQEKE